MPITDSHNPTNGLSIDRHHPRRLDILDAQLEPSTHSQAGQHPSKLNAADRILFRGIAAEVHP